MLVHKGVQYEKAGVVPVDRTGGRLGRVEAVILETAASPRIASGSETSFTRPSRRHIQGVTEETTTGVLRLYQLAKTGR